MEKSHNFFLVTLFSGFLLVGILPKFFGLVQVSFTLEFRVIVLCWTVLIIVQGFRGAWVKSNFLTLGLFFLFWVLYTIRVLTDIFLFKYELFFAEDEWDIFFKTFGVSLLPTIALIFIDFNKLKFKLILNWVYGIIYVVLLLLLYYRFGIDTASRSRGDLNLGVIYYGHFGTSLSLMSILFLFDKSRSNLISLIGLVIGILTIFISASRSPLIVLAVLSVIILYKKNTSKPKFLIVSSVVFLPLIFFWRDIVQIIQIQFPNSLMGRVQYGFSNADDLGGRSSLYWDGVNQFLESPIFGSAITLQNGNGKGFYPHNLIIESFMALGLFGGVIFLLVVLKSVFLSLKYIRQFPNLSWVYILFLQYFIFGLFSGNLYNSSMFWYLTVLVVLTIKWQRRPRI